jgi:hypothetical protein
MYLETYIVPVCSFEVATGAARICECFGTAFFIDEAGTFITAGHVVRDGYASTENSNMFLGLCPRPTGSETNVACRIVKHELAPAPFDVAFGKVDQSFPTNLTLASAVVGTWRDVATYGYPVTSQNVSAEGFWMYGRGFKGYVHREIGKGHLRGGNHPDAFETSFSMPKGLSGAPLFVRAEPKDIVVGVCVGTNRGESVEFLLEELQKDGTVRIERSSRIEEYGLAHDLRPLLQLRSRVLGDRTLAECAA